MKPIITLLLMITAASIYGQACHNTNFANYSSGTVITNQLTDVIVSATNNNGPDIAMIFDSDNPTGGDSDLGVFLGNILIISEDGDSNDPDDDADGGVITFKFSYEVMIDQLTLIDIENSNTKIDLFNINNDLIATIPVPQTGDGEVIEISLNDYSNIYVMEVKLGGSGAIDDFEYCQADEPTLPVEWSQFNAENKNGNAILTWSTASEINNEYFEVQRSGDNDSWLPIGKVDGSGTTQDQSNYFFVDTSPLIGNNYYRIKQIDYDGNEDFSEARKLRFQNGVDVISLSIFPNPTADNISIISKTNTPEIRIIISDNTGRTVYNSIVQGRLDLDLSNYPNGMFIARVIDESGQLMETHRIIKTSQ